MATEDDVVGRGRSQRWKLQPREKTNRVGAFTATNSTTSSPAWRAERWTPKVWAVSRIHSLTRLVEYIDLVNVFQEIAIGLYNLPRLNGSCSSVHQPKGTCKETVTNPTYLTNLVRLY